MSSNIKIAAVALVVVITIALSTLNVKLLSGLILMSFVGVLAHFSPISAAVIGIVCVVAEPAGCFGALLILSVVYCVITSKKKFKNSKIQP